MSGLRADVITTVGGFTLDVSIAVEPGTVLAVVGPNGSGKSTLLRAVAGLVPLEAGRITIDGEPVDDPFAGRFVAPEHRAVGVVFQDYVLFDHLTALDNVAFGLRARGVTRRQARSVATTLLDRLGIGTHGAAFPATLSGGQAQRVALARALATDPRVLLLDEPLAALDVATRRQVRRELRTQLDGFGGARILVTHDPLDAYALADRIAVLDDGRIVQAGTIAEIAAHPRSRYVADLVGTNLISGTIGAEGLRVDTGVDLAVVADFAGAAFAVVRPTSITLSRAEPDTSARNVFAGVVDDIDRLGDRVRVGVAGPVHLTAEITTTALDRLGFAIGDDIWASVKATDIAVYPA
jgi:molybdate transport system ATP-binding protein